jgi:predicted ATPase/Tfp pilus assembly protein PilF
MAELPTGTVTFLFTDVEGSTGLVHEHGEGYGDLLVDHRRKLREVFLRHGGVEVGTEGDAFFLAFPSAREAGAAAGEAQQSLGDGPVRVRMGLHTGEARVVDGTYVGIDVHRAARIAAVAHGGQVLVSQSTCDLLDHVALRALGEHRLKDLTRPERLYQLGGGEFPPLRSLNLTNLPVQVTPLVGRELEVGEILELLRSTRLLTLTGPGGAGKTRLASHTAAAVADRFPDGLWFAPLAAVEDPKLVEPAIAHVVSASDTLADHLRDKQCLLLLDNFEHVMDAAAGIGALLQAARDVTIVVTSREPLRLSAEREYPVPPLSPPAAVALFAERARAVRPSFALDNASAEICRRLDGLPLALELAAARVKSLSADQILDRLDRRLDLLTGGVRDAPERQRTLRATVDWSYGLLDEDERRLYRALSVFAGGFSLDAAVELCGAEIDTLGSLVDKSLLRTTDDGRFFMLETIREHAAELLERLGETERLGQVHAAYYLEFAERASAELWGPAQGAEAERIEEQHDNVVAAIAWFLDRAQNESALRLAGSLARFWETRGRAAEGRRLLDRALAADPSAGGRARAWALFGAGTLAYTQDDHGPEREQFKEALETFLACGDRLGEQLTRIELAWTDLTEGELASARVAADECVPAAREYGDRWLLGYALRLHGAVLLDEGDLEGAGEACLESLACLRQVGDPREISGALANLGWLGVVAEEYDEADHFLRESIALLSSRDFEALSINRNNLGLVALFQGNDAQALVELSEGLELSVRQRQQRVVAESLLALAAIAARAAMNDEAVRLWEASLEIHRACGAALNLAEERIESRYLSALGRAPNTDLERAFPRGSAPITFAEAAELGLEFATNIGSRLATVAGG